MACHFGQLNMVRFLLSHGAEVNTTTSLGYTPLHQAAQQGHTLVITLLLEHKASPNAVTNVSSSRILMSFNRPHEIESNGTPLLVMSW